MVLKNLDVDPQDLKTIIENTIKTSVVDQNVNSNEISFSKQAERVLKKSILERKNLVEDEIKTVAEPKVMSVPDIVPTTAVP